MCRSCTGALQLLWAPCQAMALVLDGASGEQRVLSLSSSLVSGKCSLDGELMAAPPKTLCCRERWLKELLSGWVQLWVPIKGQRDAQGGPKSWM